MRRCLPEWLQPWCLLFAGEWERCGSCSRSYRCPSHCIATLKALSGTSNIFGGTLDVLTYLIGPVGGCRSVGGVDLRHSIQLLDHSSRERGLAWKVHWLLESVNVYLTGGWLRLSVGSMHCSRLQIGERLVWPSLSRHFGCLTDCARNPNISDRGRREESFINVGLGIALSYSPTKNCASPPDSTKTDVREGIRLILD